MSIVYGVTWDDHKKGRLLAGLMCALLLSTFFSTANPQEISRLVGVIVREAPGAGSAPEAAVRELGGRVGTQVELIQGFTAKVPADSIDNLRATNGIIDVAASRPIKLLSSHTDYSKADGALHNVAKQIRADKMWQKGFTGAGVGVALIDSGLVPVEGLRTPGKVVNGPDLSFEQGSEELRYMDTFGHGTHMGGIIAGKDTGAVVDANNKTSFMGIAPDARLINVKVANGVGAADVSQVIVALDWIVEHRNDNGLNIRVVNLSFGTDGVQDYRLDPLTYAVEQAWKHGIVVVAAAGNTGYGTPKLNNPAYDPYVIAVGATDEKGKTTPDWSSRGDGTRNPDLAAPGKSVVSLRNPGSQIDLEHSATGAFGDRFFKGSGTSQAAAAVSGAAALLLSQRPELTPDQVKALLTSTADKMKSGDPVAQGAGLVDLKEASEAPTPNAVQIWTPSTGLGSLEASRGTLHVTSPEGVVLQGEQDIFGNPWDGAGWSTASASGAGWSGAGWSGAGWSGAGWSGAGWSGAGWSGAGWSGAGWSGAGWSESGWAGAGWSGVTWNGAGWSGAGWSGAGWSGAGWSGAGWSGAGWSGAGWSGAGWSGAGWSGAGWSGAGWSGAGWSGAGWSGAGWSGAGWSGAGWS
jgi:hypothetical protein